MATVYLARDLKHGRPVALKVLHAELAAALGPERFLREIRTAALLQHAHILPLFDSGAAEGRLWYTMPFVEGQSLRHRLVRERQLPLDDALRIATQVLSALGYAHVHGVVHRDIKPENILLDGDQAVVADFGLARAISAAGEERLTGTGLALGTAAYMSPEQAAAEESLDGRSDQYSLACVLYEMLAGEPPYSGPTAQAVIAKRFSGPPPPLRVLRDTVPGGVEQAVLRAIARSPADRYPTATEFIRALEARAGTTTAVAVRGRRGRQYLLLIGLALGALVLLAGGLWRRRAANTAPIHSLAVLPLAVAGIDTSAEYLSEGLTETLINNLSRLPQLRVTPRSTVFWYRQRDLSALEIGKELGVGAVLTWNLRRHGGALLIQAELLRVADASRLWGDQYERPLVDILAVQEEIGRTITDHLRLQLTDEQRGRLAQHPTRNPEAYELYAKGRYAWLHGRFSSRALFESSQEYFEQAIAADSTFALAWSGLADYYGASASQRFLPLDAWAKADTIARRALVLDPSLPEPHNSLAALNFFYSGDWDESERQSRAAVALNPDNGSARGLYGQILTRSGRLNEALAELRRGVALEPYVTIVHIKLGEALHFSGKEDSAIREYQTALEQTPSSSLAQDRLAQAYANKGMYAEAVNVRVNALRARRETDRAAALERAYASVGGFPGYRAAERLEARHALEHLEERAKREKIDAEQFVYPYARAGDWQHALVWLRRAAHEHPGRMRWLLMEPELDSLRAVYGTGELRRTRAGSGPSDRAPRKTAGAVAPAIAPPGLEPGLS